MTQTQQEQKSRLQTRSEKIRQSKQPQNSQNFSLALQQSTYQLPFLSFIDDVFLDDKNIFYLDKQPGISSEDLYLKAAVEALNSLEKYDQTATFTIKQVLDYFYQKVALIPKEIAQMQQNLHDFYEEKEIYQNEYQTMKIKKEYYQSECDKIKRRFLETEDELAKQKVTNFQLTEQVAHLNQQIIDLNTEIAQINFSSSSNRQAYNSSAQRMTRMIGEMVKLRSEMENTRLTIQAKDDSIAQERANVEGKVRNIEQLQQQISSDAEKKKNLIAVHNQEIAAKQQQILQLQLQCEDLELKLDKEQRKIFKLGAAMQQNKSKTNLLDYQLTTARMLQSEQFSRQMGVPYAQNDGQSLAQVINNKATSQPQRIVKQDFRDCAVQVTSYFHRDSNDIRIADQPTDEKQSINQVLMQLSSSVNFDNLNELSDYQDFTQVNEQQHFYEKVFQANELKSSSVEQEELKQYVKKYFVPKGVFDDLKQQIQAKNLKYQKYKAMYYKLDMERSYQQLKQQQATLQYCVFNLNQIIDKMPRELSQDAMSAMLSIDDLKSAYMREMQKNEQKLFEFQHLFLSIKQVSLDLSYQYKQAQNSKLFNEVSRQQLVREILNRAISDLLQQLQSYQQLPFVENVKYKQLTQGLLPPQRDSETPLFRLKISINRTQSKLSKERSLVPSNEDNVIGSLRKKQRQLGSKKSTFALDERSMTQLVEEKQKKTPQLQITQFLDNTTKEKREELTSRLKALCEKEDSSDKQRIKAIEFDDCALFDQIPVFAKVRPVGADPAAAGSVASLNGTGDAYQSKMALVEQSGGSLPSGVARTSHDGDDMLIVCSAEHQNDVGAGNAQNQAAPEQSGQNTDTLQVEDARLEQHAEQQANQEEKSQQTQQEVPTYDCAVQTAAAQHKTPRGQQQPETQQQAQCSSAEQQTSLLLDESGTDVGIQVFEQECGASKINIVEYPQISINVQKQATRTYKPQLSVNTLSEIDRPPASAEAATQVPAVVYATVDTQATPLPVESCDQEQQYSCAQEVEDKNTQTSQYDLIQVVQRSALAGISAQRKIVIPRPQVPPPQSPSAQFDRIDDILLLQRRSASPAGVQLSNGSTVVELRADQLIRDDEIDNAPLAPRESWGSATVNGKQQNAHEQQRASEGSEECSENERRADSAPPHGDNCRQSEASSQQPEVNEQQSGAKQLSIDELLEFAGNGQMCERQVCEPQAREAAPCTVRQARCPARAAAPVGSPGRPATEPRIASHRPFGPQPAFRLTDQPLRKSSIMYDKGLLEEQRRLAFSQSATSACYRILINAAPRGYSIENNRFISPFARIISYRRQLRALKRLQQRAARLEENALRGEEATRGSLRAQQLAAIAQIEQYFAAGRAGDAESAQNAQQLPLTLNPRLSLFSERFLRQPIDPANLARGRLAEPQTGEFSPLIAAGVSYRALGEKTIAPGEKLAPGTQIAWLHESGLFGGIIGTALQHSQVVRKAVGKLTFVQLPPEVTIKPLHWLIRLIRTVYYELQPAEAQAQEMVFSQYFCQYLKAKYGIRQLVSRFLLILVANLIYWQECERALEIQTFTYFLTDKFDLKTFAYYQYLRRALQLNQHSPQTTQHHVFIAENTRPVQEQLTLLYDQQVTQQIDQNVDKTMLLLIHNYLQQRAKLTSAIVQKFEKLQTGGFVSQNDACNLLRAYNQSISLSTISTLCNGRSIDKTLFCLLFESVNIPQQQYQSKIKQILQKLDQCKQVILSQKLLGYDEKIQAIQMMVYGGKYLDAEIKADQLLLELLK